MFPMGSVPAKFAIQAGMLILAARIDTHPVSAMLNPSAPASVIDSESARLVDDHRVLGIDHVELPLGQARAGMTPRGTALVIGNDLLRDTPLLLDLGRGRLRVPGQSEARGLEKSMTPADATVTPDGCLSITATAQGGAPVRVALTGRPTDPTDAFGLVRIAGAPIAAEATRGPCRDSVATVGWKALGARRVLLDVAQGKIWLSASPG